MMSILRACSLACALMWLLPSLSWAASYGEKNTAEVGIAIFPFEVESGDERSIAFSLEDEVRKALPGLINHPVYTGRETNRALTKTAAECGAEPFCVRLLGNQFNSSLAVRVKVFRVGSDIQIETEWFTTGNGLLAGKENTAFSEDNPGALVEAFAVWWESYWETSLRAKPEEKVQEDQEAKNSQGVRDDRYEREGTAQTRRREEAQPSRREDSDLRGNRDVLFDRSDPTADLRALVSEDKEEPSASTNVRQGRKTSSKTSSRSSRDDAQPYGSDPMREEDVAPAPRARGKAGRTPTARRAASSEGAQLLDTSGLAPREVRRFERSGLSLEEYQDQRYSLGKRFYLRVGGELAIGYLVRRYFVFNYIRAGGVVTEEYGYERLGAVPNQAGKAPGLGGMVGFGFAPIKELGIEVDVGALSSYQSLRWEYEGPDVGTNSTDNGGRGPDAEDQGVLLVVLDVRARAFVFPKRRFKLTPGLGVSMLFMKGFDINPAVGSFASRADAVVVGLTPLFGFNYAFNPFVSLYTDISATIYLDRGLAHDQFQTFLAGGTTSEATPQFLEEPTATMPFMARAVVGVMLNF